MDGIILNRDKGAYPHHAVSKMMLQLVTQLQQTNRLCYERYDALVVDTYHLVEQVGLEKSNERGRLSTRIGNELAKLVRKWGWPTINRRELSDMISAEVSKLNNAIQVNLNLIVQLRNPINMIEGEFGDDGSCFYAENEGDRISLADSGTNVAFCFYDGDGSERARCWGFFPNMEPNSNLSDPTVDHQSLWESIQDQKVVVIFNTYGMTSDHSAQAIQELYGFAYNQRCRLRSIVYINGINGSYNANVLSAEQPADIYNMPVTRR